MITGDTDSNGGVEADVLAVRELRIVDESGVERIKLGIIEDGVAVVELQGAGEEGQQDSVSLWGGAGGTAGIMIFDAGNCAQALDRDGLTDERAGVAGGPSDAERIQALADEVGQLRKSLEERYAVLQARVEELATRYRPHAKRRPVSGAPADPGRAPDV
jgi:hypothetical protein